MSTPPFPRPPVPSVSFPVHAWESTVVVDIDGVISPDPDLVPGSTQPLSAEQSEFVQVAADHLREIAGMGYSIILWTSRPWTALEETRRWLAENGVPHSALLMGKPRALVYIDDRAIRFTGWPSVISQLPPVPGQQ